MVANDLDIFQADFAGMEQVDRRVNVDFLWHYLSVALTCGCSVALTCGCGAVWRSAVQCGARATTWLLRRIAVSSIKFYI